MEKIKKIFILKENKRIEKCFIVFGDYVDKEVNKRTINKYIKKLEKDLNMDSRELIQNKYLYIYHDKNKYEEVINKIKIKHEHFKSSKIVKLFIPILISLSTLNIIFTNFIYTGLFMLEEMINFMCLLFSGDMLVFMFLKRYCESKLCMKTHKYNMIAKLTILLCMSTYVNHEIPELSNSLYRFEINHVNIDEVNNYESLNEFEYHEKATNTIFNNIHNNPSLDSFELECLYKLKDYVLNNPYIDLNDVFHKLMTIRVKERYSLQERVEATYNEDKNLVNIYSNLANDELDKKQALIHEYIHSIGDFSNRTLNEGMTCVITQDITKYPVMVYVPERTCVEYMIELVGRNVLLEAYSKKDDELLIEELDKIFKNHDLVLELFNKMDEYSNSEITEDELVLYINNSLVYGKIDKIEWTRIFTFHYDFSNDNKSLTLK